MKTVLGTFVAVLTEITFDIWNPLLLHNNIQVVNIIYIVATPYNNYPLRNGHNPFPHIPFRDMEYAWKGHLDLEILHFRQFLH